MTAEAVRTAFKDQAVVCDGLGSPLTAHLCCLLADLLNERTWTGRHCLNWPGDPASGADNVPLRLCGGLHSLVLSDADGTLVDAYAKSPDAVTPDLLRTAIERHDQYLHDFIALPPQTNEVARAAANWPCLMVICANDDRPIELLEFGASAGLNLNLDRFGYNLGGLFCGDPKSPVQLNPRWIGPMPTGRPPNIAARRGVDLSPFDLRDANQRLRLRSYVWPDQPDRLARLDAALAIADHHPVQVDRDDGLVWLDRHLSKWKADVRTVVFSTIAWQYLPPHMRRQGETLVRDRMRSDPGSLVWLRIETDGQEPGAAMTTLSGAEDQPKSLGRSDFHGRWIEWTGIG